MAATEPDLDFCHCLPKVELHAHLNGSISESTIKDLVEKTHGLVNPDDFVLHNGMNYKEAFAVFGKIHSLVRNLAALRKIAEDVIEEFRTDNVRYLELRTTPKAVPGTEISKKEYLKTVLDVIKEKSCEPKHLTSKDRNGKPGIVIRLLLSIDRGRSIQDARETVDLLQQFTGDPKYKRFIIGLDFSGNPYADGFEDFVPLLKEQIDSGIFCTIHVAETPDIQENTALLNLKPNRIGHAVYVLPLDGGSKEMVDIIQENQIPIELCLTSNLFGGIVKNINDHHFQFWFGKGHPLSLCTDDKGIFNTSLSIEYNLAAQSFGLSKEALVRLSYQSISCIADNDEVKECLRERWKVECKALVLSEKLF